MCTIVIEALTPLDRISRIKVYKSNARSRLFCRIANRSILVLINHLGYNILFRTSVSQYLISSKHYVGQQSSSQFVPLPVCRTRLSVIDSLDCINHVYHF